MNLFRYSLKLVSSWCKVTVTLHTDNMFSAKEKWSPKDILCFDGGKGKVTPLQTRLWPRGV